MLLSSAKSKSFDADVPNWRHLRRLLSMILLLFVGNQPLTKRCLAATNETAHSIFSDGVVPKFSIEVVEPEILALRRRPRQYVHATVRCGATIYRNVGLHLKGSTGSFRSIDEKPSFTLDFQRFDAGGKLDGLTKIHLNNSVEDPAYVNEKIGSELFRAAGLPVARVCRAVVELNGRRLGLYVLIEGFDVEFLEANFQSRNGTLYEPVGGSDIDGELRLQAGREESAEALRELRIAIREQDREKQWALLQKSIDLDSFTTFMALEVLICHRDGYSLARNNFCLYHSPVHKWTFIPHGMDQLFGIPSLPWNANFGGLVARALMENPKGRLAYHSRLSDLAFNIFSVNQMTNRVNALVEEISSVVQPSELKQIRAEAAHVCERIIARDSSLRTQLRQPVIAPLMFTQGVAKLSGWHPVDGLSAASIDKNVADGLPTLHIAAGSDTSASWRTTALLNKGIYRFEGLVKISGVVPKAFGQNQGAGLRVINRQTAPFHFVGESNWKKLEIEFTVDMEGTELALACELRASGGEAWFQADSLRLIRIQ